MLRKPTLGLFAAALSSATALIPSAASAHGMHFHGFHGGFGFHRASTAVRLSWSAATMTTACAAGSSTLAGARGCAS